MDTQKIYQDMLTDAEAVRDRLVAQAQQKDNQIQEIRNALEQVVAERNFISGQVEQANAHVLTMQAKIDMQEAVEHVERLIDTWPENS